MNLVAAIGRTPLLELERIAARVPNLRLFAKAEHLNPGGSVKDRPARAMILDGIERGLLTPGRRILEATSGNTGIADAMIGRALGFRVTLCVPGNASRERRAILAAYGAEIDAVVRPVVERSPFRSLRTTRIGSTVRLELAR